MDRPNTPFSNGATYAIAMQLLNTTITIIGLLIVTAFSRTLPIEARHRERPMGRRQPNRLLCLADGLLEFMNIQTGRSIVICGQSKGLWEKAGRLNANEILSSTAESDDYEKGRIVDVKC